MQYIPGKTKTQAFTEAFSPYLQLMAQAALKRRQEEEKLKRDKELASIKSEQGLSGYMVDMNGNAVPVFRGRQSIPNQQPIQSQPTANIQSLKGIPIPSSIQSIIPSTTPQNPQMGLPKGQFIPESFKDPFGMQYKYKPSEAEQLKTIQTKGREEGVKEGFKQAEGQKRAFKKLGSISRQFSEALPSGDRSSVEQRINGLISTIGAQTGVKPNPQLMALQNTAKLQLRAILRDMGEGARLSDQDISQNIKLIEQAGLTDVERKALVQSFMQTAVDSMDSATLKIIKEDPSAVQMLQGFNVDVPGIGKLSTGMSYEVLED